jgi:hypothetical protein
MTNTYRTQMNVCLSQLRSGAKGLLSDSRIHDQLGHSSCRPYLRPEVRVINFARDVRITYRSLHLY